MPNEVSRAGLSEISASEIIIGSLDGIKVILRVDANGDLQIVKVDEDGNESAGVLRTDNIEFNAESGGGAVRLNIDDAFSGNQSFEFPTSDGSSNQALTTDALGNLQFDAALPVPQALDDLTDATIAGPQENDILQYDGSEWVNAAGSTRDRPVFAVINQINQIALKTDNTFTDIPFSTLLRNSGEFSFLGGDAEVTVNETGWYEISYHLTIDFDLPTGEPTQVRTKSLIQLVVDSGSGFSIVPGTVAQAYHREFEVGGNNAAVSTLFFFTAGDIVKLQARRVIGSGQLYVQTNSAGLSIISSELVSREIIGPIQSLDDLIDVQTPAPQSGQLLAYDGNINQWVGLSSSMTNGRSVFYVSDATGNQQYTGTAIVVNMDTVQFNNPNFTLSNDTITFSVAGAYEITYYISATTISNDSPLARSTSLASLYENVSGSFTEIINSRGFLYHRVNSAGSTNASVTIVREFDAGDELQLRVVRSDGTATLVTIPNTSGIVIRDATAAGPQGDKGDPGGAVVLDDLTDVDAASPSDGDILVYDSVDMQWETQQFAGSIAVSDGTDTVDPTTLINFDDTYFDITDGGSGQANVTLVGGMNAIENPTRVERILFSQADDGTPIGILTPPPLSTIVSIVVRVNNSSTTNAATIKVGTATDNDAYFEENDARLKRNRIYERVIYEKLGSSPDQIIATVEANGEVFDGEVFVTYIDFREIAVNDALQYVEAIFNESDDSSPIDVFTPPVSSIIRSVVVKVETAAGSGNPTIQVGTPSDPNGYFEANDARLNKSRIYERMVYENVGLSPEIVRVTVDADGQTFSGRVLISYVEMN